MRKFKKTKQIKKTKNIKKTKKIKKTKRIKKTKSIIRIIRGGGYDSVEAPITESITEPIEVNNINNDSIYRITIEGHNYYFFGKHKKYVLIIIGDTNYIFKLKEDAEKLPKHLIDFIEGRSFSISM